MLQYWHCIAHAYDREGYQYCGNPIAGRDDLRMLSVLLWSYWNNLHECWHGSMYVNHLTHHCNLTASGMERSNTTQEGRAGKEENFNKLTDQ